MKKILLVLTIFLFPFCIVQAAEPIKILLVPGHDNEVWGAQYGNIKEADMNLVLATQIYNILKKDKRFSVYITRDNSGYTKEFADYFAAHQTDIKDFKENAKKNMETKIASGTFVEKHNVPHQTVKESVAMNLYGIVKWADENKIDAMINVHFDDYSRSSFWKIGKFKGFTVYLPETQLPNAQKSSPLAISIFDQLSKKYATSNYSEEKGGLKPDQSLIALGANNILLPSVRSVLIEYGYIYEKMFRKTTTRHKAYKDMASLTVTGIKNYFLKK